MEKGTQSRQGGEGGGLERDGTVGSGLGGWRQDRGTQGGVFKEKK